MCLDPDMNMDMTVFILLGIKIVFSDLLQIYVRGFASHSTVSLTNEISISLI